MRIQQPVVLLLSLIAVTCGLARSVVATEPVSFRNEIAPLLLEHCTSCHGPKKAEGGYRLDSFAQMSQAGDSGIDPLRADAEEEISELVRRLTTEEETERMPAQRPALPGPVIELVRRWQSEGSKFDGDNPGSPIFDLIPDRVYEPAPKEYASPIPITAVSLTSDGGQVIASGYHELTLWDAETGELVRRIGNLPERILALDWSADGKLLAVAGGSPGHIGEVRLVDWASGDVVRCLARSTDVIPAVRFQPGGKLLATGHADGTVRWFDTQTWGLARTLSSHADSVSDLRWSHDGHKLASASRDKTAKIFDAESGELLATYSGHGEPVTGVCFVEGDKEVSTVGGDRKAHRWQIDGAKAVGKVDLPAAAVRLNSDGAQAWIGLTDHAVQQLELPTSKLQRKLAGHSAWVTAISIHPQSRRLVSGSLDGEIRVWNLDDGQSLRAWIAAPGTSGENKL